MDGNLLHRLWQHINKRRQHQFFLLLLLMVIASLFEVVSIGAVIPFLGALVEPDKVYQLSYAQPLIKFLGLTSPSQLLLPLTIAFGAAAMLSGGSRLFLLWANTKLSYAIGADLSIDIYKKTLYQPYSEHVKRNSSEVISGITKKTDSVVTRNVTPVLLLASSCIMMTAILGTMFYINPLITTYAFVGFGTLYAIVIFTTRNMLAKDSGCVARETTQVFKALQEGLGGIREVLIDGSQSEYCSIYRKADIPMRKALARSVFISSSPRFAMEALGMLLIAVLAYVLMKQSDGATKVIPVLGALALGAQRLLPVLQQAYAAISNMRVGRAQLLDILGLLDQPLPDYANDPNRELMPFNNKITFRNVGFRYGESAPWVFENLNLEIQKGSSVGFVGMTGTGKSTLLDIFMGLLEPTVGQLQIDNVPVTQDNHRSWQMHLAHVPQNIYLADSTIAENIAFGVPYQNIDFERVRLSASQAHIASFIQNLPDSYLARVGEGGVRLSGGQRQRIAIARALYKKADVIVFDEATSALDSETESAVMESLMEVNTNRTVLIIAHRISTLKNCDQIIEVGEGGIVRTGQYQEFAV